MISDMDTTWLRELDDSLLVHGFLFASCAENTQSYENRDILKRRIRLLKDYGREPGDMRKILFPMAFVSKSPLLEDISSRLEDLVPESGIWPPNISAWEYVMDLVKACINRHGLRAAIADENLFSVIPWFWHNGQPLKDGSVNITYKQRNKTHMCMCMYM